jgi:hypothetical protein
MLDTPFVLCRDVDGRSWLRPKMRRWGAMGTAGGLPSAAAPTSWHGARASSGPVEELASRAIERSRALRMSGRWRRPDCVEPLS